MGTIAQKLEYLATTKTKIKDSINLTGAGITNEPFRQYSTKLKDAYVDIINNGTETLYNNFPKQTGTGETLSLTPTYQAPMQIDLKGNTSQEGTPTPDSPQDIHNVSGNNQVVINDSASDTTTYPINLPNGIELCKIGTYQDYIYKEDDKWYLHKEIGKITFDGSETWSKQDNSSYSNTILRFRSNVDNVNDTSDVVVRTIANYFKGGNLGTRNVESITTQFSGSAINIFIDQSRLSGTDVSDFTIWLTTHNTITYFVYKTPTNTEITDTTLLSQLEAIYNANSKNGTTKISQENNDLPFNLTISALEKEV